MLLSLPSGPLFLEFAKLLLLPLGLFVRVPEDEAYPWILPSVKVVPLGECGSFTHGLDPFFLDLVSSGWIKDDVLLKGPADIEWSSESPNEG